MQKSIRDIAETFGLTIDVSPIPGHDPALRVYRGAKQIFIGTDDAVRKFLAEYDPASPSDSLKKACETEK